MNLTEYEQKKLAKLSEFKGKGVILGSLSEKPFFVGKLRDYKIKGHEVSVELNNCAYITWDEWRYYKNKSHKILSNLATLVIESFSADNFLSRLEHFQTS